MKRITKGEDFNMSVSELKGLRIKEGVGRDCSRLWKMNGEKICRVENVRVSEQTPSESLPEGYFIEKRFSTIKTLDGNWVLVPGFDTYGFINHSCNGMLENCISKFKSGSSLWVDEKHRVLYIEDSFILQHQHQEIDLSPLDKKNSHMPIFLVDNTMSTIGYWHNGQFHNAVGTEMKGTKVNPLVDLVLAG